MEPENRRLGNGMRVLFEGDADPQWESAARGLLAAIRRGESETALRQQAGRIQNRFTGRVVDADCQCVVELAEEVAADA